MTTKKVLQVWKFTKYQKLGKYVQLTHYLLFNFQEFLLLDEFCETRDAHEYEAIGNVPVEGKLEWKELNASNKSISAEHVFSKWTPDDDLDTINTAVLRGIVSANNAYSHEATYSWNKAAGKAVTADVISDGI